MTQYAIKKYKRYNETKRVSYHDTFRSLLKESSCMFCFIALLVFFCVGPCVIVQNKCTLSDCTAQVFNSAMLKEEFRRMKRKLVKVEHRI